MLMFHKLYLCYMDGMHLCIRVCAGSEERTSERARSSRTIHGDSISVYLDIIVVNIYMHVGTFRYIDRRHIHSMLDI
jgi:hypothetical protein